MAARRRRRPDRTDRESRSARHSGLPSTSPRPGTSEATASREQIPPRFRLEAEGLCIVLVLLAGIWAYSNSLDGVFVLDDMRAIVQNETIRTLTPLEEALRPPPRSTVSGRPLANLTFAVNYAISELNVRSYHVGNVLIHLACALTLFGVVRRTLLSERLRPHFGGAATYVAAAAALIWVVHPLTTSAVTYIVQRVESLMSLFYLLTLYCAIRAADGARRRLWTMASVICCALGMTAKEVMVTAPVAVMLWDVFFVPSREALRRTRRGRWMLYGGLAATWIVFAALLSGERRAESIAMTGGMAWRYLLTQTEVLTRYLKLVFVPSPLIFLYTWPLATSATQVIPAAVLIVAMLALTILGLVKRHPLACPAAVFFLILAPTSSVIPIVTEVAAEHRMYLPLAAVVSGVVAASYVGLRRFVPGPRGHAAAALVTVLIGALLGMETRARNRVYASDEQLWADTVAKDPNNQRARVAYGSVLAPRGRLQEAEGEFRRAVEMSDSDAIAQSRLGSALAAAGKMEEAIPHLRRALALNDADVDAHRTLGQILALQRADAEAVRHLERALQAQPDNPQLLVQVASVRVDSKDPSVRDVDRAVTLAERAVAATSRREAMALDVLGLAYARQGRLTEAVSAAQDAVDIARASGHTAAASSIETRLRAYRARLMQ